MTWFLVLWAASCLSFLGAFILRGELDLCHRSRMRREPEMIDFTRKRLGA